ncbi:putative nuclease HARBI1 [Centruroides vittatus]|uniref:putative nuclease HARBI1 n=1 Tax=Centruroides vittatus TaxID=120091 RepID=UPI00350F4CB1
MAACLGIILEMLSELDSESEEEELILVNYLTQYKKIALEYRPNIFKEHFRVSRLTFENLLKDLVPILLQSKEIVIGKGRNALSVDQQLLMSLWLLANQESFRGVGDRFGVCRRTAWRCLMRIVRAINVLNTQSHIINWPSAQKARKTAQTFAMKYGITGVIGCLDGKHIAIKAPLEEPQAYINRKGFHSLVLQGVCDEKMCFIDCYIGEVGSVHDCTIFKRSEVYHRVCSGDGFPHADFHIIGDGAYQLSKHLIVPYRDNGFLSSSKIMFNNKFSSCRQTIERAFAHLVGRFRRLKFLDMSRMDLMVELIAACCTLHNICVLQNDESVWSNDEERVENGVQITEVEENVAEEITYEQDREMGYLKREQIMLEIMSQANRYRIN